MRESSLIGRWIFSHEEDGVRVYSPRAAARPRRGAHEGLDLEPDGSSRRLESGPADAPAAVVGSWAVEGDRLLLREGGTERALEIVAVRDGELRLRPA